MSRPPRRAFALTLVVTALAAPSAAHAARTVYFADPVDDTIAQLSLAADGSVTPLTPAAVAGVNAKKLAMTPDGELLMAITWSGKLLQYDVGSGGHLAAKAPPSLPAGSKPHSIAVAPGGADVYVTDADKEKVRHFRVGAGGLEPGDPAYVKTGDDPGGLALTPDGRSLYVLTEDGIELFDVAAGGSLSRKDPRRLRAHGALVDIGVTPDGRFAYVADLWGSVLQLRTEANGALTPLTPARVPVRPGAFPAGLAITPDGKGVQVIANGWAMDGGRRMFGFAVGNDGTLAPRSPESVGVSLPKLRDVAVAPSGRSLFVAGGDGTIFDVGLNGVPVLRGTIALDLATGVTVSPNQAPVARFVAATAPAGSRVEFDASSASDVDGTIVRYDWDFGDGTTRPNGGPRVSHVYTSPGTYRVTLTVTDNEGASTGTVFTGGAVLENGLPTAVASQDIVIPAAAAPPGPPSTPTQALAPDLGETVLVEPARGTVRVRPRGSRRFVRLGELREIPVGSTVDTRRGRARLFSVRDRKGAVQRGVFYGGLFKVFQRRRDRYITEVALRGKLAGCPAGGTTAQASARRTRRVWGRGKGRYRTRGRYSSGAVRGTVWLTADRCDGTLTAVRTGRVAVRDFVLNRTFVLRKGQRYLARPR